jgi:hypothetical protein
MAAVTKSQIRFPPNEIFGIPPLTVFTEKDREDAVRHCFLSIADLNACIRQRLYLQREQSESELNVMNLKTVREMTGWDSPSANPPQYFAAALLARLTIALEIDPRERFLDFLNLSTYAVAESLAAFKLYIGLLGGGIVESSDAKTAEPPKPKGRWLSKLFR